jgi:low affinity Fe/Cu permease
MQSGVYIWQSVVYIGLAIEVLAVLFVLQLAVSQIVGRLSRLERKLNAVMRRFDLDPDEVPALSDRVKEIARDPSRKIAAIKVYREETGATLREAKTAVEAYLNQS